MSHLVVALVTAALLALNVAVFVALHRVKVFGHVAARGRLNRAARRASDATTEVVEFVGGSCHGLWLPVARDATEWQLPGDDRGGWQKYARHRRLLGRDYFVAR